MSKRAHGRAPARPEMNTSAGANRPARPHSPNALAVALIPFVTMCLSVPLWDRIYPRVLGLPFNLFWLGGWEVLTVACLALAHRLGQTGRAGQAEWPL